MKLFHSNEVAICIKAQDTHMKNCKLGCNMYFYTF